METYSSFVVFSIWLCFLQPVRPFPSRSADSRMVRMDRFSSCRDHLEYPNNNLCCLNCEAGEHVKTPCTEAGKKGTCEECDYGTFTEHANGLNQCFKCLQCRPDQEVVRPCTPTQNSQCQCKAGRFCHPDHACEICKKCSSCKSDEEVVRNCTATSDTECRKVQTRPPSDSASAVIVVVALCALGLGLVLFLVGGVWFVWRKMQRRDSQRIPPSILKGRLDYCEVSRAGSTNLMRAQKHPADSEDESMMLCESLSSSASNSQHSLTALQGSAAAPWQGPRVPSEPSRREEEPFPTLTPVNGVDSLRKCFDFFGDLNIDYHNRFFRGLSLNDNVIKSKDSLPYEDRVHELLNIWVEQEGREASLNQLLSVLLDLNQRRTAETVKERAIQTGLYTLKADSLQCSNYLDQQP
ncbi:tumor necrosis factor receptor superfamily member 10B isoform X1 [Austrofundulus limnaeus]|uniref:Tumor necrosis factor receptor superfamily member 10B isoform X1 n=1 Tax=Austrofundulus limnaeus TaxID=52670 RepID=A0A2I4DCY5_AUSLI|nr:PREDICTED: tumor necrosis factor receptor superfamily member 10B-like isoform X1 [Austrofundulus limnaeus]